MTLQDDLRHCCEEVDRIQAQAKKLKGTVRPEVHRHFAELDRCLERFSKDARDATDKLRSGTREGLGRVVDAWREAHSRLSGHLRLIEAKSFLVSAKRLAVEGDFVAAGNELAAAVRDAEEAAGFLRSQDQHLVELKKDIEQAAADVEAKAANTTAHIEGALKHNERLLDELERLA